MATDPVRTMDVTPSPDGYRRALKLIMESSSNAEDRLWAANEFEKIRDVVAWPAAVNAIYSDRDCADMITAAIEGGIGYWSTTLEYHWGRQDPVTGRAVDREPEEVYAVIRDDIEEDSTEARIDVAFIRRGIDVINTPGFKISDTIKANINSGDAGNVDADAADCIVQAAMFGEIVYG